MRISMTTTHRSQLFDLSSSRSYDCTHEWLRDENLNLLIGIVSETTVLEGREGERESTKNVNTKKLTSVFAYSRF